GCRGSIHHEGGHDGGRRPRRLAAVEGGAQRARMRAAPWGRARHGDHRDAVDRCGGHDSPLRRHAILYFAKISSIRLNALSIAASGLTPSFATSIIAMLHTCWE